MIEGRVIRMIEEDRIIINVGKEAGVERNMTFGIYTPADDVVDPETGDKLGVVRQRKAVVVVQVVYDKFALAGPQTRIKTSLSGGLRPTIPRYETEAGSLPIDRSQLEPLPTGSSVRIGDTVEQLSAD